MTNTTKTKDSIKTINPATGKVHQTYKVESKDSASKKIDDTHEAFLEWRDTSIKERGKVIQKMGKLLKENKEDLAQMMCEQMGKPIKQGQMEVSLCAKICEYTAEHAEEELKDEEKSFKQGRALIKYQPLGVIFGMQPWNFPLYQVIRYSTACLAAGNTTVVKHAEICWETANRIKELYEEAGLPKDAFNVLYVPDEIADELIAHSKIRGVNFTGSAKAGKIVAKKAGAYLKKTVLELGGSDPYIILDDVNLEEVVPTCVTGRTNNAGQTCVAAKRFIVLEAIYDEFKEQFVEAMSQVEYGDPSKESTKMGPLAREDLRKRLQDQVTESVDRGAQCLIGGEIPEGEGFFYPATVLENVKPGMPAYEDELFGPVASLIKVKDEKEALKVANDHRYGLGGGVFSADTDRALKLAEQIETGMVCINGYFLSQPNLPFGGVKDSGYGREHGGFGIKEFVNIKTIMLNN